MPGVKTLEQLLAEKHERAEVEHQASPSPKRLKESATPDVNSEHVATTYTPTGSPSPQPPAEDAAVMDADVKGSVPEFQAPPVEEPAADQAESDDDTEDVYYPALSGCR